MKKYINRTSAIFLFCVLFSSAYAQTVLVSPKYKLMRTCEILVDDKYYSYHLLDDYHEFVQQKTDKHLEKLIPEIHRPARVPMEAFDANVRDVVNRALSDKEKKRMFHTIFVGTTIDVNGNVLFVELGSFQLLDKYISPKHLTSILHQVKRLTTDCMRKGLSANGYIEYTVPNRFRKKP